jgi:hypothetical protein
MDLENMPIVRDTLERMAKEPPREQWWIEKKIDRFIDRHIGTEVWLKFVAVSAWALLVGNALFSSACGQLLCD